MIEVVGHIAVFVVVGVAAILAPLAAGYLVRPKLPSAEKLATYECGEPTIGSSYVQFDLRFYVVALLFIIFDVELAFFFPWAAVYGGAMQLADGNLSPDSPARIHLSQKLLNQPPTASGIETVTADTAVAVGAIGLVDILIFFGVLLVGFAYVWKRGDLDWVRAVTDQSTQSAARPPTPLLVEPESQAQTVGT
jgi:NADH-quinone oxidoreductase subunit A